MTKMRPEFLYPPNFLLSASANVTSQNNLNNQMVRPGGMNMGYGMNYGMIGGAMVPVDNGYGVNDVANLFIQQQVGYIELWQTEGHFICIW